MTAMARGTALVTTLAEVMDLTSVQDLGALVTSDFVAANQLVSASDTIYDRLVRDGIDPTTLTNAEAYKRAVAWVLIGRLYLAGPYVALSQDALPPREWIGLYREFAFAKADYDAVRPLTSVDNTPRHAGEARPVAVNPESGFAYGDGTLHDVRPKPSLWRRFA